MIRITTAFCLTTIVTASALAGCSDPAGPGGQWHRHLGVIEIGGSQTPPLELPETVVQGVSFTATVVTFGSSSCNRADGADVSVSGRSAQVRPYDRIVAGVCTDDLRPYPREVTLRFDQAGEATVRVIGRTVLGASAQYEAQVQVVAGS